MNGYKFFQKTATQVLEKQDSDPCSIAEKTIYLVTFLRRREGHNFIIIDDLMVPVRPYLAKLIRDASARVYRRFRIGCLLSGIYFDHNEAIMIGRLFERC